MAERLGNLGYVIVGKETTAGTAVTPSVTIPVYKESLSTDLNIVEDNPVAGNKFARYAAVQGLRSHKGSIEFYAEPNTAGYIFDMLLTRGATTGSGPYTQPYTLGANSNSYTVDVSSGNVVFRFMGVQASKISPKWDKNELHLEAGVSALGSFMGRQITSITGSGPYTTTLDTTYDPNPTNGLVVGDLIRYYDTATGATVDATIATIPTATTFTTVANPGASIGSGDFVHLRPQTPTLSLLSPFLWAKTEFRFAADATTALTASQTRVEQGTEWQIEHKFESDNGAQRSGSFDPAALVRTLGDGQLKIKKYFDTPSDLQQWSAIAKNALVIRHFSGATNQYELRITFNNLKYREGVKPDLEADKILYEESTYMPVWDSTDSAAMSVTILNGIASF